MITKELQIPMPGNYYCQILAYLPELLHHEGKFVEHPEFSYIAPGNSYHSVLTTSIGYVHDVMVQGIWHVCMCVCVGGGGGGVGVEGFGAWFLHTNSQKSEGWQVRESSRLDLGNGIMVQVAMR